MTDDRTVLYESSAPAEIDQPWYGFETLRPVPRWSQAHPNDPPKLTPMRRVAILRALRAGMHRGQAAIAAGISPSTFSRWLEQGERDGDGKCGELYHAVIAAEMACEYSLVASMQRAAVTDWRAAEALLKRRYPDRWGDRQRLDLASVEDEEFRRLRAQFPELSDDEIREAVRQFLRDA